MVEGSEGRGDAPENRQVDRPTNEQLWVKFQKEKTTLENRSPNTLQKYGTVIRRFFFVMDKHVSDIQPSDLSDFIFFLQQEGQQPSTLDWTCNVLKSFYKWLVKRGFVQKDPWGEIHRKAAEIGPPKALPWDECMERLEDIRGKSMSPRDRALTIFLLFTGARLSEALSRRMEHIQWTSGRVTLTHTKGRQPRIVYLPEDVMRELSLYAKWVMTMYPDNDVLFPGEGGKPISQEAYRKAMRGYGLRWTPHQLRHTALTELLKRTRDLRLVQEIAGHRDIATTSRYLKVWDEDKRDAARTLAGSLGRRSRGDTRRDESRPAALN